jgi:hypothetical protein
MAIEKDKKTITVEQVEHLERALKTILSNARNPDARLGDFVAMQQHSSHFSRS